MTKNFFAIAAIIVAISVIVVIFSGVKMEVNVPNSIQIKINPPSPADIRNEETPLTSIVVCDNTCKSPDSEYEAIRVGYHYQIKKNGTIIFTTHDKFNGSNDIKAASFVFYGKQKTFRAAYHYGHKGPCTWIGSWDIEKGNFLGGEEVSRYIYDTTKTLSKENECS